MGLYLCLYFLLSIIISSVRIGLSVDSSEQFSSDPIDRYWIMYHAF